MKKTIVLLALLTLYLSACGSPTSNDAQAGTRLPDVTLLAVGTLKLESTDQAVTGEQASQLLPMWQVYQSLTSSGTAAQAEIDGLVEQIQGTMTAGQMEAISEMSLTQQDVFALMQEKGGDMKQVRQSSDGSGSASQNGGGYAMSPGNMSGGAPPDGGGALPDGGMGMDMGGMGGAAPATSAKQGQGGEAGLGAGRTAGVPTVLVEALIQVLEQKAGS